MTYNVDANPRNADWPKHRATCPVCSRTVPPRTVGGGGQPKQFCSERCRLAAKRRRETRKRQVEHYGRCRRPLAKCRVCRIVWGNPLAILPRRPAA